MPKTTVWIVGAGAIGQLYGYHLHKYAEVSLFGRAGQALSQPLQFTPLGEKVAERWQPLPAKPELSAQDLLLICCKCGQTAAALAPLQSRLSPDTPILLMQNGMGSESQLQALPNPLLKASITHGALRHAPTQVQHTGSGSTALGLVRGTLTQQQQLKLLKLFQQALPPVSWDQQIASSLWRKLVINAAINPLTALHRVPNGALLQAEFKPQMEHLIDEAVTVAQAEGVELDLAELRETVYQVAEATAGNRSSMLQDVEAGRSTELAFITGYLLRRGEAHQLPLPHNQTLYEQLSLALSESFSST